VNRLKNHFVSIGSQPNFLNILSFQNCSGNLGRRNLLQREHELLPFAKLETCQDKTMMGKDFLVIFQVNVQRSSDNEHNKKTVIPPS